MLQIAVGLTKTTHASSVGFTSSGQQRTAVCARKLSVASGSVSRSLQYRVGNIPLFVTILSQINQVHVLQSYFFNASFIILTFYYYVYQVVILSFPIKTTYAPLFSSIRPPLPNANYNVIAVSNIHISNVPIQ